MRLVATVALLGALMRLLFTAALALAAACNTGDGRLRLKDGVTVGSIDTNMACGPYNIDAGTTGCTKGYVCAVLVLGPSASGTFGPSCFPSKLCDFLTCGGAPYACELGQYENELGVADPLCVVPE